MVDCKPHPDQHFGCHTYSQHGEDLMLLNIFNLLKVKKPSYLDLGAHHPTIISNTKLLYDRGSRGVNVEANPNLIAEFNKERPEDINLNIGVGLRKGESFFFMYSPTSGRNTFSIEEVSAMAGIMSPPTARMQLQTKTINQIVMEHCNARFPNLLSCDIEGLDYAVLDDADFNSMLGPMVICVETRPKEAERMIHMLYKKDFFVYCRMGENLIFVHATLASELRV